MEVARGECRHRCWHWRAGRWRGGSRALAEDNPSVEAVLLQGCTPDPSDPVYGPVCIAARPRGQSILPGLFSVMKAALPERHALRCIADDNLPSIRAHEKLGMQVCGGFGFGGRHVLRFRKA